MANNLTPVTSDYSNPQLSIDVATKKSLLGRYFSYINPEKYSQFDDQFYITLQKIDTLVRLNPLQRDIVPLSFEATYPTVPSLQANCTELFQIMIAHAETKIVSLREGDSLVYDCDGWSVEDQKFFWTRLSYDLSSQQDIKTIFITHKGSLFKIGRRGAHLLSKHKPELKGLLTHQPIVFNKKGAQQASSAATAPSPHEPSMKITGIDKWLLCHDSPFFQGWANLGGRSAFDLLSHVDLEFILEILHDPSKLHDLSKRFTPQKLFEMIALCEFYKIGEILDNLIDKFIPFLAQTDLKGLLSVWSFAYTTTSSPLDIPCEKLRTACEPFIAKKIRKLLRSETGREKLTTILSKSAVSPLIVSIPPKDKDLLEKLLSLIKANPALGSRLRTLSFSSTPSLTDSDLLPFTLLSHLEALSVAGTRVTTKGLEYIKNMTQLKALDLSNCANIANYKPLQEMTSLSHVDLSNNPITDDDLEVLSHLSFLISLNLQGCHQLNGFGLSHAENCSILQYLNLSDCGQFTGAFLQHLKSCTTRLSHINLARCKLIGDNNLQHLANCLNLLTLNLSGCPYLDGRGLRHFQKLTSLTSLDLSGCPLTDGPGLLHLTSLESLLDLNLSGNSIAQPLLFIPLMKNLEKLNLSYSASLGDDTTDLIGQCRTIRHLNLAACPKLTNRTLVRLKPLELESLDLSDNIQLGDDDLKLLSQFHRLSNLSLRNLTKLNGKALSFLVKMENLMTLDLAGCLNLKPAHLPHLRGCLKIETLVLPFSINLRNIAKILSEHQKLETLILDSCTELPADLRQELFQIPNLRHIITDESHYRRP